MSRGRRPGARFNRGRIAAGGGAGAPALLAPQSFSVEIVASTLEPLIAAQSFDVGIVASLADDVDFDPTTHTDSGLLAAWHRTSLSTVVSSTLLGTGTSPPGITLAEDVAGALATDIARGIYIRNGGVTGARGTATIDISLDNGSTFAANDVVPNDTDGQVALNSALVGVDTNITLTYADASASANNIWEAVIATSEDQHSGNHDFTYGAGVRPKTKLALKNGHSGLLYDGVDDIGICSTSLANDVAGGTDNSFHVFWVARFVATPAGATVASMWCLSRTTDADSPRLEVQARGPSVAAPADVWRVVKQSDTGGDVDNVDSTEAPNTSWAVFDVEHSGTVATFRINGVSKATGASDVGATTLDQATRGARRLLTSPSAFANMEELEWIAYTAPVTDAAGIRSGLADLYGITL